MKEQNGNKRGSSAAAGGTVSLGGELSVNRLGFGAMRITGEGIWGPPKDRAGAIAVLRRAIELGVNFIDTADSYGPFVSEELLAEALAPYPNNLVIATKGGWNRPGPNQWTHDASPAHLRKAVEGSLKRLRLDRILYRSRTGTVLPIVNGTTSWIIANATESRSSHGSRLQQALWRAGCWRELRRRATRNPFRSHWRGC